MFGRHRTGQREFFPDQLPRLAIAQDRRRDFRAEKAGKFYAILLARVHSPMHAREYIHQLATFAAAHGLNLAMHPAIRPAGNFGAIQTVRTLEEIGLTHAFEIQPRSGKFNPTGRRNFK